MPDNNDIKKVSDIIQSLIKAKKNLRIYPSNNPIYLKTIEVTYMKMMQVFDVMDELKLRVTRNEILLDGAQVFKGVGKDDNFALFFSRDGVKELVFKSGLGQDEFSKFLEVLSFNFEREDIVDDVVTLMWEMDFENISYTVDENMLMEEEEDYESEAVEQAMEASPSEDDLNKAYDDALRGDETAEPTLVPIIDKDMRVVVDLIERVKLDNKSRLVRVLFEMLYMAENFFEFHDIVLIIENLVEYAVKNNDLECAVEIFNSVQEFDGDRLPDFDAIEELRRIYAFAGSTETVKLIGDLMDNEDGVQDDVFESYVSFLSYETLPGFITILGELKTIAARKSVINALIFLGSKNISVLAKSLGDSRWYVVRNLIYVLRKIGDPKAVSYLIKASNHSDLRVRKEVLKTLGDLGGHKASATILGFLDDPNVQVRTTAARAMGAIGTDFSKAALLQRTMSAPFLQTGFDEKKECFEILARWPDPDVAAYFMRTLKKWVIFNRAKNNELRAAAAYALGLMGLKEALPRLEKLSKSTNRLLSESSYGAIKRIQYAK